jgi:hypothetical protein
MSLEAKRTLIFAILKFLREESKAENVTADLKESLEGNTHKVFVTSSKLSFIFLFQKLLHNVLNQPMKFQLMMPSARTTLIVDLIWLRSPKNLLSK